MRIHWATLREQDQAIYRMVTVYLTGRLEERATIDWALSLTRQETAKRMAVLDLIHSPAQNLTDPWQSAWRLIEESWNSPEVEESPSLRAYDLQRKLRKGDTSTHLVSEIVELVAPQLKVEPLPSSSVFFRRPPKKPKTVNDILKTSITSGKMIAPDMLELKSITDKTFLKFLAVSLDAAVLKGLDIAQRTGWTGEGSLWSLGGLYRVNYVPPTQQGQDHDPDMFHHGLAPSVKLLHSVVLCLADLDLALAMEFIRRWKATDSLIHVRLWAAMARDPRLASKGEVAAFLLSLNNRQFWDLHSYPEIAELRAIRFQELVAPEQLAITRRLRKLPPRNQWRRNIDTDSLKQGRLYWALRELRRIEVAGASLPKNDKAWLEDRIGEFPQLTQMDRVDEGFPEGPTVYSVGPQPDKIYDQLSGEERLRALESALSSGRKGWDDDPASRAWDWIRTQGNTSQVLSDFESMPDGGAAFARVWEDFGRAHAPESENKGNPEENRPSEQARVISLLAKLPDSTIRKAIRGLSQWLSRWGKSLLAIPQGPDVWFRLWPEAVAVTNEQEEDKEEIILSISDESSECDKSGKFDVLNTPSAELTSVFLEACPGFDDVSPFKGNGTLKRMRDTVISASGRSGLIVRHRLIEELEYFLKADPDWTQEYLIRPLSQDNTEERVLWRAVSLRKHSSPVLRIIGLQMAERATDRQLSREIRRSLVFSLIIECLYAFLEKRDPTVPETRIQQMLRMLEDEIRGFAAETVGRFVHDLSGSSIKNRTSLSAEELFREAAVPFLKRVWPQERSLTTPGVSHAFAHLPAISGDAFAEAVQAIQPFLVPCECWSMIDYGLYGEGGQAKLSVIESYKKAEALLQLLNLTIGVSERAVVPHDLASALDQIGSVAPVLRQDPAFRRLSTAARRI